MCSSDLAGPGLRNEFESSRRAVECRDCGEHRIRGIAETERKTGSDERIRSLEQSGKRQGDHARLSLIHHGQVLTARMRDLTGQLERLALEADREQLQPAALHHRDDFVDMIRIAIDDRNAVSADKPIEQANLRLEVLLKGRVIVHVVARDVRERRRRHIRR